VDIDCDRAYRDMGPLDSIIQVAGRCNRNKRLKLADVHLQRLVGENGKPFTGIYSPVLLKATDQALDNKFSVPESEFLGLIEKYFNTTREKSASETELMDSVYELDYDEKNDRKKPISKFRLITEDELYKVDVFVELDKDAEEIWQK